MYFCKKITKLDTMLNRFNEVLQTAADVLAPPPTPIQNFEYHWKQVKCFYGNGERAVPKVHLSDTNVPFHLEEMLQILIKEETGAIHSVAPSSALAQATSEANENGSGAGSASGLCQAHYPPTTLKTECMDFMLNNRPLDLLVDLACTDTPPGATVNVLSWTRRFLSCLPYPRMEHEAIFQPIQKLINLCNGNRGSPYEEEEIVFLLTVAGLIRKEPFLINLFLPSHQHSAFVNAKIQNYRTQRIPIGNPLFECEKVEANIRRISIVHDGDHQQSGAASSTDEKCDIIDTNIVNSENVSKAVTNAYVDGAESILSKNFLCDCEETDRLGLLETILGYFESPDSMVVVRACEGALVLASLPSVNSNCAAVKSSLNSFSSKNAKRLATLCQQIPEDMDTGDIEDYVVSWGLIPRDSNAPHFIGRGQLNEFLCWLDYSNCLSIECTEMSFYICDHMRQELLENVVEPAMLDVNAQFMLVLAAKIVKQLDSKAFSNELANWLVGRINEQNQSNDCLLTILIENAQDNSDVLLPTLQFIESLLDNTNERILHGMLFRYLNSRGYYDPTGHEVHSWSDVEEERDRRRGSADGAMKSRTLAPTNILKIINSFLLLLPRQIMCDSGGTCYEEYVQDASRHYHNWITKTQAFNWPIEAIFSDRSDSSPELSPSTALNLPKLLMHKQQTQSDGSSGISAPLPVPTMQAQPKKEIQCNDSGISEENFYEGPLLRLLFQHVRNMAAYPYELNLAAVAILSKLAFLPHPYLHEILLNPEIPIARGTNTLWSSMQHLARQLLLEVPRREGFQKKVAETGKRLLTNPPMLSDGDEDSDPLFESLVVLEEFCKELAAIAFVKYHHATE